MLRPTFGPPLRRRSGSVLAVERDPPLTSPRSELRAVKPRLKTWHPVSAPPSPLSPAATTLDAVAGRTSMTAITASAASAADALEPCERAILSVLRLWPRGAAEAAAAHRAGLDATTAARGAAPAPRCRGRRVQRRDPADASPSPAHRVLAPRRRLGHRRAHRPCTPTRPDVQRRGPKDRCPMSSGTTSVRDQTPTICACPRRHAGGLPPHRILRLRGPILGAVTLHPQATRRLPQPLSPTPAQKPQADRRGHRHADLTAIEDRIAREHSPSQLPLSIPISLQISATRSSVICAV